MNYLLDTHAFLWAATCSQKLPDKIKTIIKSRENSIFVSAISFWEIAIKTKIGKLDLDTLKPADLVDLAQRMKFDVIELNPFEAITYDQLEESTHKDPFDRMLIWQSIKRNLIMISADSEFDKFKKYGLIREW